MAKVITLPRRPSYFRPMQFCAGEGNHSRRTSFAKANDVGWPFERSQKSEDER